VKFIASEGDCDLDKPEADSDAFYEKLDFCHAITERPPRGRLTHHPLAELLLKMQIVQINEKDVIDTIMLLLEHPLGDADKEHQHQTGSACAKGGYGAHHYELEKVNSLQALHTT
jgi:hypothetical protein